MSLASRPQKACGGGNEMWPFSRRYDTETKISQLEINAAFDALPGPRCFAWPLDSKYLLWSRKDAEHFAWKYGVQTRPYISSISDCDDSALDGFAAWRAGARRENLPLHPAYGVMWLKCLGAFGGGTHMMKYWLLKEGLYRYEPQTGDFTDFSTVEKVFARMG